VQGDAMHDVRARLGFATNAGIHKWWQADFLAVRKAIRIAGGIARIEGGGVDGILRMQMQFPEKRLAQWLVVGACLAFFGSMKRCPPALRPQREREGVKEIAICATVSCLYLSVRVGERCIYPGCLCERPSMAYILRDYKEKACRSPK
jgi:hypothetical protein